MLATALDGDQAVLAADRATESLRAVVASTHEDPLVSSSLCNGTAGLMLAVDACFEIEPRLTPVRNDLLARMVAQICAEVPLRNPPAWTDVNWAPTTTMPGM